MSVHVLSVPPDVISMSHVSRIIEPTAKSGSFHGQSTHHLKISREWVIHNLNGMSSFSLEWAHNFKLNIYSRHEWQNKARCAFIKTFTENYFLGNGWSLNTNGNFLSSKEYSNFFIDQSDDEHSEISLSKPACYCPSATCLHLPKPVLVSPCFHIEGHTAATPGQNTTCTWKINKSQM